MDLINVMCEIQIYDMYYSNFEVEYQIKSFSMHVDSLSEKEILILILNSDIKFNRKYCFFESPSNFYSLCLMPSN